MQKLFIGVDLHKTQFTCYFLSAKGDGISKKFATNTVGYTNFIQNIQQAKEAGFDVLVAVESTGNTRYFKKLMDDRNIPVTVVNTMKFKVVNESVNKTDKRDAKTIAEFLSKDMLPESRLCSEESEQLKRLIKTRKILVDSRVQLKNQVHGILLGMGINSKRGQLNSKKGRAAILESISDKIQKEVVRVVIDSIETIESQVKKVEKQLDNMTENDRVVEILKTISGTGSIIAITVRAHIDDIQRFKNYRKLSSFCGLVPWVQCSNETNHYGHITKRGSRELRTAVIQMVLGMIRCKKEKDNRLMQQYRFLKKQKGSGKALVAIARKFTRIIWTLLMNDNEYDSEKLKHGSDFIDNFELNKAS